MKSTDRPQRPSSSLGGARAKAYRCEIMGHPTNQPCVADADAEAGPDERNEPTLRWSAWRAFTSTWIWPARTGTRTQHVSLPAAFLVHVVAALLCFLAITVMIALSAAFGSGGYTNWPEEWVELLDDMANGLRHRDILVATLATAAFVEVAFPAIALLFMSWGARDEPIRSSYRHALRQVWLHTTHFLAIILVVGLLPATLHDLHLDWASKNPMPALPERPYPPTFPRPHTLRPDDPGYAKAQAVYEAAMMEYNTWQTEALRVNRSWQQRAPWVLRHRQPLIMMTCFVSGLWVLWALMRGIGAPRRGPPIDRPPTCENCGYNLTSMPMEGRCPECGESIASSLGPDVRPGSDWQQRRLAGRWRAYWRTHATAITKTQRLGRSLRLVAPGTDHRRFLGLHLPFIFLLGAAGLTLGFISVESVEELKTEWQNVSFVALIFGCFITVGTLCMTTFAALLVGVTGGLENRRNLMSGAMQVASYLVGYVALWVIFGALSGSLAFILNDAGVYTSVAKAIHTDHVVFATLTWMIPNAAWFIYYMMLVSRGTRVTRFANT